MRRHNFKKYTNFYVIINKKNWTELYKLQIINNYSLYTPLLWSLSLIVSGGSFALVSTLGDEPGDRFDSQWLCDIMQLLIINYTLLL